MGWGRVVGILITPDCDHGMVGASPSAAAGTVSAGWSAAAFGDPDESCVWIVVAVSTGVAVLAEPSCGWDGETARLAGCDPEALAGESGLTPSSWSEVP